MSRTPSESQAFRRRKDFQGSVTARTPTRGELNRVLHSGRGYTRSGQGAGQTRASRTRLSDQPGAGNQLVGESTPL